MLYKCLLIEQHLLQTRTFLGLSRDHEDVYKKALSFLRFVISPFLLTLVFRGHRDRQK